MTWGLVRKMQFVGKAVALVVDNMTGLSVYELESLLELICMTKVAS